MPNLKRPNNKAIIPSTVRFNTNLTSNEKLLYGEILALCGKGKHCWPSNQYFADLYSVSTKTISRALAKLNKEALIDLVQNTNKRNRREIHIRSTAMTFLSSDMDIPVHNNRQKCLGVDGLHLIIKENDINNDTKEEVNRSNFSEKECQEEPSLTMIELSFRNQVNGWDEETIKKESLKFYNHYKSIGWRLGRNKIVDIKCIVNNWILRTEQYPIYEKKKLHKSQNAGPNNPIGSTLNKEIKSYEPKF